MDASRIATVDLLRRIDALEQGHGRQGAGTLEALQAELEERPMQDVVTAQAQMSR